MLKTNQGTNNNDEDGVPQCYGKSFDAKEPACVGGHDPTYWNGQNRIRESCTWVPSCSVKMQATQRLIPPSSLVRQYQPQQPQPPQQSRPYTSFIAPTAASSNPGVWTPPASPYSTQQPRQQQPIQHWGNAQYGVPQYLSVREPASGRTMLARLLVEIWRSMGKSFGHTIAHFFDVESVGPRNNGQPPHQ